MLSALHNFMFKVKVKKVNIKRLCFFTNPLLLANNPLLLHTSAYRAHFWALNYTVLNIPMLQNLRFQSYRQCTTATRGNIEDGIETKWSVAKRNKILQLVNSSTLKQLTK